jgi:hypothetical protein
MSVEKSSDGGWLNSFLEEVTRMQGCGGMVVWDERRQMEAIILSVNSHLEIITGRYGECYEIDIEEAIKYRLYPPLVTG